MWVLRGLGVVGGVRGRRRVLEAILDHADQDVLAGTPASPTRSTMAAGRRFGGHAVHVDHGDAHQHEALPVDAVVAGSKRSSPAVEGEDLEQVVGRDVEGVQLGLVEAAFSWSPSAS